MFCHKVNQLLKTREKIGEILILRNRSEPQDDSVVFSAGALLYALSRNGPLNDEAEASSCSVGLKKIFSLPSKIIKLSECEANDGYLIILTIEGTIWKVGLPVIFGEAGTRTE